MNPFAEPAHIGPIRKVVRYLRNRVAPGLCTFTLNGFKTLGVLRAARWMLPPAQYQTLLRLTNGGITFYPARRYLERVLMPATCPPDGTTIALIGIHPFTTHYAHFYLGHRVVAFDPDARMGACRGRAAFVALPMREVARVLGAGTVALVHCNGVVGWGLDDAGELAASLDAAHAALVPGGRLILGYDTQHHNPFGWTADTLLPAEKWVELHAAEYPVSVRGDHVFRVFAKAGP